MVIPNFNFKNVFATHLAAQLNLTEKWAVSESSGKLHIISVPQEVNINILTEVYSHHTVILCMSKCALLLQWGHQLANNSAIAPGYCVSASIKPPFFEAYWKCGDSSRLNTDVYQYSTIIDTL